MNSFPIGTVGFVPFPPCYREREVVPPVNCSPAALARSEADDWRIAYHESGHVVLGRLLTVNRSMASQSSQAKITAVGRGDGRSTDRSFPKMRTTMFRRFAARSAI
jgi:hypothetical protein